MLAARGPNRYSRHGPSTRRTRSRAGLRGRENVRGDRLAATIEKWWPEIEGFLQFGNTNAH